MDEGKQPLTGQEEQQLAQKSTVQQAEAETGTFAAPRTATRDPSVVDPRFDRDDLRQGKPPPAIKHRHMRRIKIRRPRAKKGTPYKMAGAPGPEGATTDGEADEGEMTEEEVEVEHDEQESTADEGNGEDKKKGIFSKILGKS